MLNEIYISTSRDFHNSIRTKFHILQIFPNYKYLILFINQNTSPFLPFFSFFSLISSKEYANNIRTRTHHLELINSSFKRVDTFPRESIPSKIEKEPANNARVFENPCTYNIERKRERKKEKKQRRLFLFQEFAPVCEKSASRYRRPWRKVTLRYWTAGMTPRVILYTPSSGTKGVESFIAMPRTRSRSSRLSPSGTWRWRWAFFVYLHEARPRAPWAYFRQKFVDHLTAREPCRINIEKYSDFCKGIFPRVILDRVEMNCSVDI